jgi:hypothetical protein
MTYMFITLVAAAMQVLLVFALPYVLLNFKYLSFNTVQSLAACISLVLVVVIIVAMLKYGQEERGAR